MIDRSLNCTLAFFYASDKPYLAEMLTATIDCGKLKHSTPENKLIALGALIASGKLEKLENVLQQLDFKELTHQENSDIV